MGFAWFIRYFHGVAVRDNVCLLLGPFDNPNVHLELDHKYSWYMEYAFLSDIIRVTPIRNLYGFDIHYQVNSSASPDTVLDSGIISVNNGETIWFPKY